MAYPHPGVKIIHFDKPLDFEHQAGTEICLIPCPPEVYPPTPTPTRVSEPTPSPTPVIPTPTPFDVSTLPYQFKLTTYNEDPALRGLWTRQTETQFSDGSMVYYTKSGVGNVFRYNNKLKLWQYGQHPNYTWSDSIYSNSKLYGWWTDDGSTVFSIEAYDSDAPTPTPSHTPTSSIPTPTPTPTQTQTPTPTPLGLDTENPTNPEVKELEFRWHLLNGKEILQVKNTLKPSHANFSSFDTSVWSTVYAFNGDPSAYDLSDAMWPNIAVDEEYQAKYSSSFNYDGLQINLVNVFEEDKISGAMYQRVSLNILYNLENGKLKSNSGQLYEIILPNEFQPHKSVIPLFLYDGDANNQDSALGNSDTWPMIIKSVATSHEDFDDTFNSDKLVSDAKQGDDVISVGVQSKFNINDKIVIAKGTSKEETNEVIGFGSLRLKTPLLFDHSAETSIEIIDDTEDESTPTPTQTPTQSVTITNAPYLPG